MCVRIPIKNCPWVQLNTSNPFVFPNWQGLLYRTAYPLFHTLVGHPVFLIIPTSIMQDLLQWCGSKCLTAQLVRSRNASVLREFGQCLAGASVVRPKENPICRCGIWSLLAGEAWRERYVQWAVVCLPRGCQEIQLEIWFFMLPSSLPV